MSGASESEREALMEWWNSEWPRDGSDTLDVLATTVDQIANARVKAALEAAADEIEARREQRDRDWEINECESDIYADAAAIVRAAADTT